jgi:hypothetical protein
MKRTTQSTALIAQVLVTALTAEKGKILASRVVSDDARSIKQAKDEFIREMPCRRLVFRVSDARM